MKQSERVLNTKKALAASLKELLKGKPLSKITVNDIASGCGLNRKTFYYHFEDIYDLLKWMLNEEAVKIIAHFDMVTEYRDAILFAMDYVEQNDYILNCIYDSVGHDELKRFFYNDFIKFVEKIIRDIAELIDVSTDDDFVEFLADFYTAGISNLLINWIKDTARYPREELLENVYIIFRESIPAVLKKKADTAKGTPGTKG